MYKVSSGRQHVCVLCLTINDHAFLLSSVEQNSADDTDISGVAIIVSQAQFKHYLSGQAWLQSVCVHSHVCFSKCVTLAILTRSVHVRNVSPDT